MPSGKKKRIRSSLLYCDSFCVILQKYKNILNMVANLFDFHYINYIFRSTEDLNCATNRLYGDWVALTCTNKTGGCPYFKLMSKSEYIEMCNDFNNKNAISPVQEYSKKMSSMIKECFKSVELKEKINRYAQSNYGSSINRKP